MPAFEARTMGNGSRGPQYQKADVRKLLGVANTTAKQGNDEASMLRARMAGQLAGEELRAAMHPFFLNPLGTSCREDLH